MKALDFVAVMILVSLAYATTGGPEPVPSPPGFYINTTTLTLCKGMSNNIPITVTNTGSGYLGQMQNLQLAIVNSKGIFSGTGSGGIVNTGSSKTANLSAFVDANASSFITAEVSVYFYFDNIYTDSEIRNVTFGTTSCPQPLSADLSPKVLTSGEIENVTLNFTNSGSTTLNSISASAIFPQGDVAWLSRKPVEIAHIGPGNTISVPAKVYVYTGAPQAFGANLSVNYYNGSRALQIWDGIELLSGGIINVTASSFTISPEVPRSGSVFSVSFVLTNVGTSSASAVTATVVPPAGFTSFGSGSVFVGDIGVDSQTPVTITLVSGNNTKTGTYNIPIRINYLNSLRDNISQRITVPVAMLAVLPASVPSNQGQGSEYGAAILILLIIIVVMAFLLYMDKMKLKRRKR